MNSKTDHFLTDVKFLHSYPFRMLIKKTLTTDNPLLEPDIVFIIRVSNMLGFKPFSETYHQIEKKLKWLQAQKQKFKNTGIVSYRVKNFFKKKSFSSLIFQAKTIHSLKPGVLLLFALMQHLAYETGVKRFRGTIRSLFF